MNFRAVLALPKMAGSAQTHKSISSIWIVWSTLYVYLWWMDDPQMCNLCLFPTLLFFSEPLSLGLSQKWFETRLKQLQCFDVYSLADTQKVRNVHSQCSWLKCEKVQKFRKYVCTHSCVHCAVYVHCIGCCYSSYQQ